MRIIAILLVYDIAFEEGKVDASMAYQRRIQFIVPRGVRVEHEIVAGHIARGGPIEHDRLGALLHDIIFEARERGRAAAQSDLIGGGRVEQPKT